MARLPTRVLMLASVPVLDAFFPNQWVCVCLWQAAVICNALRNKKKEKKNKNKTEQGRECKENEGETIPQHSDSPSA